MDSVSTVVSGLGSRFVPLSLVLSGKVFCSVEDIEAFV